VDFLTFGRADIRTPSVRRVLAPAPWPSPLAPAPFTPAPDLDRW
jgi:hypothetical protein